VSIATRATIQLRPRAMVFTFLDHFAGTDLTDAKEPPPALWL
jgi:hypothetical protein